MMFLVMVCWRRMIEMEQIKMADLYQTLEEVKDEISF